MIEQLLEASKEKIEFAYANAIERQVKQPIVLLLDVRSDDAAWVAERLTERSRIDEVLEESRRRESIPTLTVAVSRQQALLLVGELDAESRAQIDRLDVPDTHFPVVIVEGNRLGCALHPLPE